MKSKKNTDSQTRSTFKLNSLAPKNDIKLNTYKEALDQMFLDDTILNVGMTGPYGSGKSSTIETYKTINPNLNFIHIALGRYKEFLGSEEQEGKKSSWTVSNRKSKKVIFNKKPKESEEKKQQETSEIEGKIINQLLHQINAKKIPQAFTKVKKNNKSYKVYTWAVFIPIMILSFIYIFKFGDWVNYVNYNNLEYLNFTTNAFLPLVVGSTLLLSLAHIIKIFGKAQINRAFIRKIAFQGNEIELFQSENSSFFDEHLNEVIYLFENSNADVIVFEDLDRFDNSDVFRKLKEINQLLNRRIQDKNNKKIYARFTKCLRKTTRGKDILENKFDRIFYSKQIIFLYLIRDDIFISKDRTKFFDLIIPIIPVIDSTNSFEKITDLFNETRIKTSKVSESFLSQYPINEIFYPKDTFIKKEFVEKERESQDNILIEKDSRIEKIFLRKLAFFIDDMRLMYNISNEYKIYDRQINNEELDRNKLLALITYKNIFPKDFADLQYRKGFIYSIFENKKTFIETRLQTINNKIEIYKEELKSINEELLVSITELTALYMKTDDLILEADLADSSTHIEFIKNLLEEKEVESLEYKEGKIYNGNTYRHEDISRSTPKTVKIEELISKMEKSTDYLRRKEIIEKKMNSRISELEKYLNKLEEERSNVRILSVSKSLNREEYNKLLEEHPSIKSSEHKKLLYLLIEEGYINETYSEYMNYFYGTHFSIDEKMFITNLLDDGELDYELPLSNFDLIQAHLQTNDYRRRGILNYDLFSHLLETNRKENLESIITVAANHRNIDFILNLYQYLNTKEKISEIKYFKLFLEILNNNWADFYQVAIIEKNILEETVTHNNKESMNNLIFGSLCLTDFYSTLSETNPDQVIWYINENFSLLLKVEEYNDSNFDYFYLNLKELNIKFNELDFSKINSNIVSFIIEENIYKLNFENIKEVFLYEKAIKDTEINGKDFKEKNLTHIRNSKIEPLKARLEEEINDYLINYIEFSENNIRESNEIVVEILNRDDVAVKDQFIEAIKIPVKNINEIKNTSLWEKLLEYRTVEPTIDNIISYFKETDQDDWTQELIEFVNGTDEPIQVEAGKNLKKVGDKNFFIETLGLNDLKDKHYRSIIGSSKETAKDFLIENLDISKVEILIEELVIEMNSKNLKFVSDNYPTQVVKFVKKNLQDNIELVANSLAEIKLVELMKSGISSKMVDDLLSAKKTPISLKEFDIRSKNFEKILDTHLKENDKPYLFENYSNFNSVIKKKVLNLGIKNRDIVASDKVDNKVDKNLIFDLLKSEEIEVSDKERLMMSKIGMFDFKDILELVPSLNLSKNYREIAKGSNPKFKNSEINQTVIKYLKKLNIISSWKTEEDNTIRVFSKRK